VSSVLQCHAEGIKVVPRGAGLAIGGRAPLVDGGSTRMAKFQQHPRGDFDKSAWWAEAGRDPTRGGRGVEDAGFLLRADPASQIPAPSAAMWRRIPAASLPQKIRQTTNNVLRLRDGADDGRGGAARPASISTPGGTTSLVTTGSGRTLGRATRSQCGFAQAGLRAAVWSAFLPRRGCGRVSEPESSRCRHHSPGGMEMMDKRRVKRVEEFRTRGTRRRRGAADRRARRTQAEVDHLIMGRGNRQECRA